MPTCAVWGVPFALNPFAWGRRIPHTICTATSEDVGANTLWMLVVHHGESYVSSLEG